MGYIYFFCYHYLFSFVFNGGQSELEHNQMLGTSINWLKDPNLALPAVIVMTIWKDFGYAVVMYMAGLYSLPMDVMEAAKVDGASSWQNFRYITLPLSLIHISGWWWGKFTMRPPWAYTAGESSSPS